MRGTGWQLGRVLVRPPVKWASLSKSLTFSEPRPRGTSPGGSENAEPTGGSRPGEGDGGGTQGPRQGWGMGRSPVKRELGNPDAQARPPCGHVLGMWSLPLTNGVTTAPPWRALHGQGGGGLFSPLGLRGARTAHAAHYMSPHQRSDFLIWTLF